MLRSYEPRLSLSLAQALVLAALAGCSVAATPERQSSKKDKDKDSPKEEQVVEDMKEASSAGDLDEGAEDLGETTATAEAGDEQDDGDEDDQENTGGAGAEAEDEDEGTPPFRKLPKLEGSWVLPVGSYSHCYQFDGDGRFIWVEAGHIGPDPHCFGKFEVKADMNLEITEVSCKWTVGTAPAFTFAKPKFLDDDRIEADRTDSSDDGTWTRYTASDCEAHTKI